MNHLIKSFDKRKEGKKRTWCKLIEKIDAISPNKKMVVHTNAPRFTKKFLNEELWGNEADCVPIKSQEILPSLVTNQSRI